MEKILRTLDRAGDELREEHDVRRVRRQIVDGLLISPVHFHHIAQALKRMEGQPDRQDDVQRRVGDLPAEEGGNADNTGSEEIEVLEDDQDEARRDDTGPKQNFSGFPDGSDQINAGKEIDEDRDCQDQDI